MITAESDLLGIRVFSGVLTAYSQNDDMRWRPFRASLKMHQPVSFRLVLSEGRLTASSLRKR